MLLYEMQNDPRLSPKDFARKLRRESTDAERRLWTALRDRRLRGFKFRRQHPLPPYVLDFYCVRLALCIELDGGGHLEADQVRHDAERSAFLKWRGIKAFRFKNYDALVETQQLVDHLWVILTQRGGLVGAEGVEEIGG
jgi:very-short-patch-repair endonuclease